MLSVSSVVACLMVASIAVQATPQTSSATSAALNKTATAPQTSAMPTKNMVMKPSSTANESLTLDALTSAGTSSSTTTSEAHTPAVDLLAPSATTAELDSPTTTTSAPLAGKNVKTTAKNTTNPTEKKSSQSSPAPISQGTFEYMTAFLSVGLLTLVV
ncbi:hypothetical protein PTTG_00102, partial [Puccinia triticina 1-1 BBBD Race 1]|uniref:Uncharacterized protein n=2 Tax=Puccinia triticina TaxID=208348 RepID=A0ABY7CMB5_9BASI